MKTVISTLLVICFSAAIAQPTKHNPPPFDKTMSAYTQKNIQDTLFNKSPLSLANGGNGGAYYNSNTADDTTTSGSLVSASGLSFPVAANEIWTFTFTLSALAASSTVGIGISFPSGGTLLAQIIGRQATSTNSWQTITASATAKTGYGTTSSSPIIVTGKFINGSNAGNVQLQFENTAGGGLTTINANSFVESHKQTK